MRRRERVFEVWGGKGKGGGIFGVHPGAGRGVPDVCENAGVYLA